MTVDALKIYCNSKGKPVKRKKKLFPKILLDLLALLGFETS